MKAAQCSIIIPVFNKPEVTGNCLKSIYHRTELPFDLILIDNGSAPATQDFLEHFKSSHDNVHLVRNETNEGWVKAVNRGIAIAASRYICFMNNDTIVRTRGWLSEMIGIANSDKDIGLINPRFEVKKRPLTKSRFIETDFCRGYCILVKREVIDRIGQLDEAFGMGYWDDDDFSMRAVLAGFKCVMANNVLVEHLRNSTFLSAFGQKEMNELHAKNRGILISKWGKKLRLGFIVTDTADKKKLPDLLFTLARRQHRIDIWNLSEPLNLEHTNIRQRIFPRICSALILSAIIHLNKRKNPAKHYKTIFSDDSRFGTMIKANGYNFCQMSPEIDHDHIVRLVDSLSRER